MASCSGAPQTTLLTSRLWTGNTVYERLGEPTCLRGDRHEDVAACQMRSCSRLNWLERLHDNCTKKRRSTLRTLLWAIDKKCMLPLKNTHEFFQVLPWLLMLIRYKYYNIDRYERIENKIVSLTAFLFCFKSVMRRSLRMREYALSSTRLVIRLPQTNLFDFRHWR